VDALNQCAYNLKSSWQLYRTEGLEESTLIKLRSSPSRRLAHSGSESASKERQHRRCPPPCASHGGNKTGLTDVDADALTTLSRPPIFPYLSMDHLMISQYGKISGY